MTTELENTTVVVTGGGPAGMMAGYLLARAGVDVLVLEKHRDFLRDFRGDTIHPSTLELMHELGLYDRFLALPHSELRELWAQIGQDHLPLADFTHLPTRAKFLALMPQWDFLDFIADEARQLPSFKLWMEAEASGLTRDPAGKITGVTLAAEVEGHKSVSADLVIAADGRHSVLRQAAGLTVTDFAAPMDVLWFRVSRQPDDPPETFGNAQTHGLMVMLDRTTYWQCAYIIPKGGDAALRQGSISAFRDRVRTMQPFLADRVSEIKSWEDVKLLTVTIDRLERWHQPGFLAIGDAAHAMSPIGGVGINLAIQDAVATANRLAAPLLAKTLTEADLAALQQRRQFPTKLTQGAQILIQKQVIDVLLHSDKPLRAPWILKFLSGIPLLRRIPAYFVGVGVRPEHIRH
jgi:2-polyprenyl-6-methoxyphenol hydroxylase-like FAD-dependent oxidoreductase